MLDVYEVEKPFSLELTVLSFVFVLVSNVRPPREDIVTKNSPHRISLVAIHPLTEPRG